MMPLYFYIVTLLYLAAPFSLQPLSDQDMIEIPDATGQVSTGQVSTGTGGTSVNSDEAFVGNTSGTGKEMAETAVLVADILANQTAFLENAQELDPVALDDVIGKINDMLQNSLNEEKKITDTLAEKLAAFNEGSSNVLTAEEALTAANEAVQSATSTLAATKELHVVQTTEKNDAQKNYDDNFQSKKDEQQVLTEVLNLLNGLTEEANCVANGMGGSYSPARAGTLEENALLACESVYGKGKCSMKACGSCDNRGYHSIGVPHPCNGATMWNFKSTDKKLNCGWVSCREVLISKGSGVWESSCGNNQFDITPSSGATISNTCPG